MSELIFITGATGFIGAQTVENALKAGYRVRLSVRKAEQEAVVRSRYPEFQDHIETIVIADLSKPESFNTALKDVDYVFHIASPMPKDGGDIHLDYVEPAVQATLSILKSALAFEKIKKVSVVSSALALSPVDSLIRKDFITVKENNGEVFPVDLSANFPDGFIGGAVKYTASKILAHQATRDFLKNNNPQYKLITIHPVFVMGHSLIQDTDKDIGGMNAMLWLSLFSEKPAIGNAWVDVHDVAEAHIKALTADLKSGTEILLSTSAPWGDVASYVKEKYPSLGCKLQPPFEGGWDVETPTADKILGLKWRSYQSIIDDVVNQQLSLKAKSSV
ncbi:dihydroflavonal-4-reductase [Penicillium taxi]|uniref:dihydroflavonal-4-reductase n=1 Tax=Penicillium taxi TaxID=168475 RepID=UPI002545AF27|nr:dihydroflavonal-4-reductase [Penicillium taxi]KAJ5888649.1 dihydroflavonal-4-reductase [Penicillium taxi]